MLKNWINHILVHGKTYLLLTILVIISVFNLIPAAQSVFQTISIAEGSRRKLPVYSVETSEKRVAISFDAAWGAEDTDDLLTILRQYDVKATFFLCGYWVDKYPDKVKKIYEEGHDIANHSNTHAHGSQLSLAQNKEEITAVHEKIKKLIGIEMDLYRAPYGDYNDTVIQAVEESHYFPIQWDVDTLGMEMQSAE